MIIDKSFETNASNEENTWPKWWVRKTRQHGAHWRWDRFPEMQQIRMHRVWINAHYLYISKCLGNGFLSVCCLQCLLSVWRKENRKNIKYKLEG